MLERLQDRKFLRAALSTEHVPWLLQKLFLYPYVAVAFRS